VIAAVDSGMNEQAFTLTLISAVVHFNLSTLPLCGVLR
jgi:hypothetical protein